MVAVAEDNKCPAGYIKRKGYTRKYRNTIKQLGFTVRKRGKVYTVKPKTDPVYVPSSCIKDRGLPGKGPNAKMGGIGPLRKGELIKYGYSYRLADSSRRAALKRAVDRYGALSVYHKLDAVAKLSIRTAPDASRIFKLDRDWIRSSYTLKN